MSFSDKLDPYYFLLFSAFMFYFIYLYNQIKPINISIRATILLFNIPSIILWYTAFVYNDFLSITPISYEMFMSLFFVYTYWMLYLFLEHSRNYIQTKKVVFTIFKFYLHVE